MGLMSGRPQGRAPAPTTRESWLPHRPGELAVYWDEPRQRPAAFSILHPSWSRPATVDNLSGSPPDQGFICKSWGHPELGGLEGGVRKQPSETAPPSRTSQQGP